MLIFILVSSVVVVGGYIYYTKVLSRKFDPSKRAEEFIKNNRLKEAVYEYRKLIEADPFDFVSHYRLAEIHMSLGDYDEAMNHYNRLIEINKYNIEVNKERVEKNLAKIYVMKRDIENAYRLYSDIYKMNTSDDESVYYCAFIALGQEEYEISQKYFEQLLKLKQPDFEIFFGAGICSYQNQKTAEALSYFKSALEKNPESDIANLAMAFALKRKRDFKKAVIIAEKLVGSTEDQEILFALMRLDAVLNCHMKKYKESVSKFEALLGFCRKNGMKEEELITLYDLGFACLFDEQASKAYDYWNNLAEFDRNYKGIQANITALRKEMNDSGGYEHKEDSVFGKLNDWLEKTFDQNFLWSICGLKSDTVFDLRAITSISKNNPEKSEGKIESFEDNYLEKFISIDGEKFRIVSGRVIEKLGFRVNEFLSTYKESDGVDISATERSTGNKTYIWVRRWKKTRVGEIPLRNFAQAVNDNKARTGIFISTAELTESAISALERTSKVRVVQPDELNSLLKGVIDV